MIARVEEIFVVVVVPSLLFFLVALVRINLLYSDRIPSIGTLVFTERSFGSVRIQSSVAVHGPSMNTL